jgi:hypothetical protein
MNFGSSPHFNLGEAQIMLHIKQCLWPEPSSLKWTNLTKFHPFEIYSMKFLKLLMMCELKKF